MPGHLFPSGLCVGSQEGFQGTKPTLTQHWTLPEGQSLLGLGESSRAAGVLPMDPWGSAVTARLDEAEGWTTLLGLNREALGLVLGSLYRVLEWRCREVPSVACTA